MLSFSMLVSVLVAAAVLAAPPAPNPCSTQLPNVSAVVACCAAECKCEASAGCSDLPMSNSLPNVMLMSDSIGALGSGYFSNVRALLGPSASAVTGAGAVGNAVVHHTGSYGTAICGSSFGNASCVDTWMARSLLNGSKGFDVIHFNWGLHDICAKMYAPVTAAQYLENMETLYTRMKKYLAPNGTMIWSSTTPVPPSYHNRVNSDVLRINAQMATLFGRAGKYKDVVLSDMYGSVVRRCNTRALDGGIGYPQSSDCTFIQSRGVHFSDTGKQFTALVAAGSIMQYL